MGCTDRPAAHEAVSKKASTRIMEASCGQCQFGMDAPGCDLAVRLDGTPYFVDGSGIDDHGDAHGAEGLCNAVRMAEVTGTVVDGRFIAERFVLQPQEP
ncbi:MAG: DUF6370 family protein [Phycisphaerales bacterium]|nr:DUF6370 family protein [Phycisphaerales bacterium]